MVKTGDKFVIEIESTYVSEAGKTPALLYKVKGFNSLVFDQNGIEKLTPYPEPTEPTHDLKVGDEILDEDSIYGIVIVASENGIMYMDATTCTWFVPTEEIPGRLTKTGTRYPEVGEILKSLRRGKKVSRCR